MFRTVLNDFDFGGSILSYEAIRTSAADSAVALFSGPIYPFVDTGVPFSLLKVAADGTVSIETHALFDQVPTAVHARAMATADFNGDGLPDFYSGNHGYDTIPFPGETNTLILSDGIGTWRDASATLPFAESFTHSVASGDIDGDGDIDVLVGVLSALGNSAVGPYFLLNTGDGTFERATDRLEAFVADGFELDGKFTTTLLVDVDADGDLDAVFGSDGQGATGGYLYLNDGSGQFLGDRKVLPVGLFGPADTISVDVTPIDLNGDGALDLIFSQTGRTPFYSGGKLQALVNDGNGNYTDETHMRLPGQPENAGWVQFVEVVDFNSDGHLDLLSHLPYLAGENQPVLWLNDGSGHFSNGNELLSGFQRSIMPVHLNDDGIQDYLSFGGYGGFDVRGVYAHLSHGQGQGTWMGTFENDFLFAGGQDDRLVPFVGDDILNGGAGVDTAVFAGAQAGYILTLSPSTMILSDRRATETGGQGNNTLISIEYLDFDTEIDLFEGNPMKLSIFDGPTTLTAPQFSEIIELYIAYFNRAPDALGLFYWATEYANGFTVPDMAANFFYQPETQATYTSVLDARGNLDTSDPGKVGAFVTEVYANVLGRSPDAPGFNYWVNELTSNPSITPDVFILAIIGGAKFPSNPTSQTAIDQAYLATKSDLGAYFAVIKGMSDIGDATAAMALYDGSTAGRDAALSAMDGHYADALDPTTGDFLMPLVGVIDDPFL